MGKLLFLIVLSTLLLSLSVSAVDLFTCDDFLAINCSGTSNLKNNIDCSGKNFGPQGLCNVTPYFEGTFDGEGNNISNVNIACGFNNFCGMFMRAASGSVIKNFGLIDNTVTTLITFVGGVVGVSGATIDNVFTTGNVTSTSSPQQIGGIVGITLSGSIINNSYTTGVVKAGRSLGGIAGRNVDDSLIINSYSTGLVNGTQSEMGGDSRIDGFKI